METRALSAALAAPAFHTRGAGVAMHAAERHIERWAPEARANTVRPLRSLGFVDRLVSPWLETAQRTVGMRLLGQSLAEREPRHVSWVFPRPWYLDELAWLAAARQQQAAGVAAMPGAAPLLTTRGTYVAPAAQSTNVAMPAALYEYVAPSLSLPPVQAQGTEQRPHAAAYSSLVPFAALHAAEVMARVVAPMQATPSPQLRRVLATMLARSAVMTQGAGLPAPPSGPSRKALEAPELVTPPAPVAPEDFVEQVAAQRARVVELQRLAQAQIVAQSPAAPPLAAATPAAEAARIEERVAQRIAGGAGGADSPPQTARLHDLSRREAASHARAAAQAAEPAAARGEAPAVMTATAASRELASAFATAVRATPTAALPPELAAAIAHEPAHAA